VRDTFPSCLPHGRLFEGHPGGHRWWGSRLATWKTVIGHGPSRNDNNILYYNKEDQRTFLWNSLKLDFLLGKSWFWHFLTSFEVMIAIQSSFHYQAVRAEALCQRAELRVRRTQWQENDGIMSWCYWMIYHISYTYHFPSMYLSLFIIPSIYLSIHPSI
jgi:hypothetical protein